MTTEPSDHGSLVAERDQPLIGLFVRKEGRLVVRYFTDEAEAAAAVTDEDMQAALRAIGAWSELDWDEAVEELDRIRHETPPTPPIEL